jgi:hypothetical protein
MIGVVLSHFRVRAHVLGTELLVQCGRAWRQIRPRLFPNDDLSYDSLGHDEAYVRRVWYPGARVEFDGYGDIPLAHRRPTHPEDVLVLGGSRYDVIADPMSARNLLGLVQPFIFGSVRELFSQVVQSPGSHSAYVPAGTDMERSAGYVLCSNLHLAEPDKILLRDGSGEMHLMHVKDRFVLESVIAKEIKLGQQFHDLVVRLVLDNPFQAPGMPESRCYPVISHVMF